MTDYSKWKVTELKAELKRRGVPQTGLKLKQDFIDKLVELDLEQQNEPASEDAAPEPSTDVKDNEQGDQKEKTKADETTASQQSATESLPTEKAPTPQKEDQDHVALDSQPEARSEDAVVEANRTERDGGPPADEHPPAQPEQPVAPGPVEKEHETDGSTQRQVPEDKEEAGTFQVPTEVPATADPSVAASEAESEIRKRKRRSQSPPPSAETIKKSKVDNKDPKVILQEDVAPESLDEQGDEPPATAPKALHQSQADATASERRDGSPRRLSRSMADEKADASPERRDHRFRDLLPSNKKRKRTPSPELVAREDERQVEPALHPATSAVYIRDLMRPLQPVSLKNHLISLALSPEHDSHQEVLLDFFLDPIKTHCFALFRSVSSASKVRSRIHGAIWPNERDRKPLWADFIPEDKVSDWIKTEQDSAFQSRAAPRWEVVYERTDRGVEAFLQEFSGTNSRSAPTAPAPRQSHDLGSRRESQPAGPQYRQRGGEGFKALDERFLSTKTKPKLYYLPVPRDIIDKRLDRFAAISRRGSQHRHPDDDMRRITFEDVDVFVDDGPEYGFARNRGGRRPGRGSWRGRMR